MIELKKMMHRQKKGFTGPILILDHDAFHSLAPSLSFSLTIFFFPHLFLLAWRWKISCRYII